MPPVMNKVSDAHPKKPDQAHGALKRKAVRHVLWAIYLTKRRLEQTAMQNAFWYVTGRSIEISIQLKLHKMSNSLVSRCKNREKGLHKSDLKLPENMSQLTPAWGELGLDLG